MYVVCCLFIFSIVCLFVFVLVCLFVSLFVCLFICLFVCLQFTTYHRDPFRVGNNNLEWFGGRWHTVRFRVGWSL